MRTLRERVPAAERLGCGVAGCVRPYYGAGLCNAHYQQKHVRGQDLRPVRPMRSPGAGHVNQDGYRVVCRNGRSRGEHVWVMEEFLGRELFPDEEVHHVNGVRLDNRIENLELWSTSHPPGQRVADKVGWARTILSRYAPELLAP